MDVYLSLDSSGIYPRPFCLLDAIFEKSCKDIEYREKVYNWLRGDEGYSTVYFRDEICEPLRNLPKIVEYGKQFNVTTEWHNTWIPIDSAIYNARLRRIKEDE